MLHDIPVKADAETITDTQSEVKTKAFLDALPYILA